MAIDKAVDSAQLDSGLTDIADAIRGKGGTSAELAFPQGFVAAIDAIPTGGNEWTRPAEWPNLDAIDMTGFEGVYFTYDNRENDGYYFAGFYVSTGSGNYTVERGTLANGVFTAIDTHDVARNTEYKEYIDVSWGDFVIYRVIASGHITQISMSLRAPDIPAGLEIPAPQHCVERYGRLPNLTNFTNSAYLYIWGCTYTQHDKIYDLVSLTTVTAAYNNAIALKKIELPGFDGASLGELTAQKTQNFIKFCGLPEIDLSKLKNFSGVINGLALNTNTTRKLVLPANSSLTNGWSYGSTSIEYLDFNGADLSLTTVFPSCDGCRFLKYLNMAGCDASNITTPGQSLRYTFSLVDFYPPSNLKVPLNIQSSSNLSRESLLRIIDALAVLTTTQTLRIPPNCMAKLSEAEIAVATEKGWTIA